MSTRRKLQRNATELQENTANCHGPNSDASMDTPVSTVTVQNANPNDQSVLFYELIQQMQEDRRQEEERRREEKRQEEERRREEKHQEEERRREEKRQDEELRREERQQWKEFMGQMVRGSSHSFTPSLPEVEVGVRSPKGEKPPSFRKLELEEDVEAYLGAFETHMECYEVSRGQWSRYMYSTDHMQGITLTRFTRVAHAFSAAGERFYR